MARRSGRDWTLDNAEGLHAQHPTTFFIPSAERRHHLRFDDSVRLIFLTGNRPDGPSGERMWVTDVRAQDGGRYVGTLTNQPTIIEDLAQGDEIEFGPENVIALEDPHAIPDHLLAFAARRLIEDETLVPGSIYHRPADLELRPSRGGRRASGWNLLVGDEADGLFSDSTQVLTPSLGWLAERYPRFGDLVRSGAFGREFGWNVATSRYVDVGPYREPDE